MTKEISPVTHKIIINIAKIILALGIIGLIIFYTPIFDLLYYFAIYAFIPFMFLMSIGLIAIDTLEIFKLTLPELKERINKETERLKNERSNQQN